MANLSAGKEILSYCNKCKLALAHTIVVMKDANTVGKVECRTCKTVHAYKDPHAATKKTVTKRKSSTGTRKKKTQTIPLSEVWEQAVNNSEEAQIKYSPRSAYVVGNIINHPKFGLGVVEKLFDNNKMEILFQYEYKVLVHKIGQ